MTRAYLAGAAALTSLLLGAKAAEACTCADMHGQFEKRLTQEQIMAARLERADLVARGTITGMRAGADVVSARPPIGSDNVASLTVMTNRVAVADFVVEETLKGRVEGTVQLVSGLGMGDCGIAGSFLGAIGSGASVSLELRPVPDRPGLYWVDMCGYQERHFRPMSRGKG